MEVRNYEFFLRIFLLKTLYFVGLNEMVQFIAEGNSNIKVKYRSNELVGEIFHFPYELKQTFPKCFWIR